MPPWEKIAEALGSTEFMTGLVSGALAFAVGAAVARGRAYDEASPVPVHGILLTLSTLAAIQVTSSVPLHVWLACVLLATGGAISTQARRRAVPLSATVALPGAMLVAFAGETPGSTSTTWLVMGAVIVGAPLLASFDRRHRDLGLGPVLFTITVVGAYVTLPDTEGVLAMLGAALPLTLLGWPRPLASIGPSGAYALLGVYAWVAASGGHVRTAAVIGAMGALGLLVVEPIARWMSGGAASSGGGSRAGAPTVIAFAAAQVLVVSLAARFAGTQSTALWAGFVAVTSLATATLAMILWGGASEPSRREPLPLRDHGPS